MVTAALGSLLGLGFCTATQAGAVPTPPNNAAEFLNGTGAFSVVQAGEHPGRGSYRTFSGRANLHGQWRS